ncbi:Electron transfer DM13 [Leptolyngbya sp. PCC 7375]|nr:Electron transfer DM13 [Leptolyngbya sp. PCC 7375]
MKLTYFAALAVSSMLTVSTAIVTNSFQPAYAAPCAASSVNPCAANPCAANPCAADPCAANPCAADPCAANPCAANPCAANPCAADPCAADPCAAGNPCAATGTGSFVAVSSDTVGGVTIVEENGKRYLEFDETFSTDDGPDLFVLLHKEATPQSYSSDKFVNLGDLQSINGSQRYEIPEDISIDEFKSAVIWCRQFNVTFGFAAI